MAASKNSGLYGLLVAVVVIASLYLARVVFVPLALALLLSLVLTPIVSFLERIFIPRIVAIFLVVLVLVSLAALVGWKASRQFVELTERLPAYRRTLEHKIHSLPTTRDESLNRASDTIRDLAKDVASVAPGSSLAHDAKKADLTPGSSSAKPMPVEIVPPANPLGSLRDMLGPLVMGGVVAIFTIFILMGREDLRNRFIRLASGGRLNAMTKALDDATRRINRYFLLQLCVNATYGTLIGIGLHFIGVPNASLWGLAAGVLRFLPYVGPPMAAVMPILLSIAVFPGWGHALATLALFVTLEVLVSNFVEPLLYGSHVGLSPLAILIAAIFWVLIWGFPGLILSTPLTVCLVVMGRHIPRLKFLSILLGDEPVLSPHVQYYQRLLASDHSEARQILEEYLKDKSVDELYASVLIPALGLAEEDRHRNALDKDAQDFIYQTTREIIQDLDEDLQENPAEGNGMRRAEVVCVPARDDADEVVGMLLVRLLLRRGHTAIGIPIGTVREMLDQVSSINPGVVCISALPPFALNHAANLYGKLRSQHPGLHIVVCLWQFEGDSSAAAARLKLAQDHELCTTLPQALYQIEAHPLKTA